MFDWEWESFEQIFKQQLVTVDDHGPLIGPIHRFSITRDASLQLVMNAETSGWAQESAAIHAPGTVRVNDDRITFRCSGLEIEAKGVEVQETTSRLEGVAPALTTQQIQVRCVTGGYVPERGPSAYVIDWIANMPSAFIWSDMVDTSTSTTVTRTWGGVPPSRPEFSINRETESGSSSWSAAQIDIDGISIIIGKVDASKVPGICLPGYIIYQGTPDECFRNRIRSCLSFCLGTFLVYLGAHWFGGDWSLNRFEALSGYSMRGYALELPTLPPFPLGSKSIWELESLALGRLVGSLFAKYEDLNLDTVLWAYWHAVAAAPHISAVHFGAAIESLQRAYFKSQPSGLMAHILDESTWENVRRQLELTVDSVNLDAKMREILTAKIRNLNSRSQHSIAKDLVEVLGLSLGSRERKAHDSRHESAHGKDTEVDIEWVRDLKLLRIRLHRLLLAMTGGADSYFDYFSLNMPIRKLNEAVPD